jgi:hypothetical protein
MTKININVKLNAKTKRLSSAAKNTTISNRQDSIESKSAQKQVKKEVAKKTNSKASNASTALTTLSSTSSASKRKTPLINTRPYIPARKPRDPGQGGAPIARLGSVLAFLLVPTEEFDTSAVGPFGDPTGAQFTSYGASPGLVRSYTNTYWTVTNWRPYVGYVVVGGVWRNIGRVVPRPVSFVAGEIDQISQQILPPLFENNALRGPVLRSKRFANTNLNFHKGPWMERTISEVHIAHAVATRTNFRYRDDTSQQRLEYLDNTPLTLQPGARNAMTLEFIVQLGKDPIPADGGDLRFNQGLPFTDIKGLNQLELRLEGYTSGVWGQGAYDKFDLYLRQGHGNDADSTNLLNFEGGQSVDNDPQSGDIVQYAEGEVRKTLWRPDYDYNRVGNKTLVGVNGNEAFGTELGFPITFKTADSLAARPVHCALVFTNQQTRLYIEGTLRHTAPAAPKLLSAQTMRVYASMKDSAYKEYGNVTDFFDVDRVQLNADLFKPNDPDYLVTHVGIIWDVSKSWSGEVEMDGTSTSRSGLGSGSQEFGVGVPLYPLLSLNGKPTYGGQQPGVIGRVPWTAKVSDRLDASIWDLPDQLYVPSADGDFAENALFQTVTIYDQFGEPFRYHIDNENAYDFTWAINSALEGWYSSSEQAVLGYVGQTLIFRAYITRIEYPSGRTGSIRSVSFDDQGTWIPNDAALVPNLANPRSTVFNGPSRLSGIRLTSRELYTGSTVRVPSEITSLDPGEDSLSTPAGEGGPGGGGGGFA